MKNALAQRQNSNELARPAELSAAIEAVLIQGDLSKLTTVQRVEYYNRVCDSLGLNPLTKPFDYMKFRERGEQLYATRNCTDQLRQKHNVSVRITKREDIDGVHVVYAAAKLPNGREDESTGAVAINGLKGEALANALMKAETKAKRRVTLSICGLSMLDETEVETVPGAKTLGAPSKARTLDEIPYDRVTGEVIEVTPEPEPPREYYDRAADAQWVVGHSAVNASDAREARDELRDPNWEMPISKDHKGKPLHLVPAGFLTWYIEKAEQELASGTARNEANTREYKARFELELERRREAEAGSYRREADEFADDNLPF